MCRCLARYSACFLCGYGPISFSVFFFSPFSLVWYCGRPKLLSILLVFLFLVVSHSISLAGLSGCFGVIDIISIRSFEFFLFFPLSISLLPLLLHHSIPFHFLCSINSYLQFKTKQKKSCMYEINYSSVQAKEESDTNRRTTPRLTLKRTQKRKKKKKNPSERMRRSFCSFLLWLR